MLTIILGNIGSGKTLFMVILAKYSKLKTISNFNLKFKYELFDLQSFLESKYDNCNIYLDEAYSYLESRLSISELNRLMSYMLFQSRKKSLNLVLSAQLLSTLDKRFRMLADMIILCNHIDKTELPFKYKIISKGYNRIITKTISFEKAKDYFKMYDTNQIIQPINCQIEEFFKKQLSGKDKMEQIRLISDEILKKYPNKRITKSIVELYFMENDLPQFLMKQCYTFIKLNYKIKIT